MAKKRKRLDINEVNYSIFDAIKRLQASISPSLALPTQRGGFPDGSFDVEARFRAAISAALKACPLSRYQVAARMSELVGREITKSMIDSWTAESKEQHRFPAIFLPAFCQATGQNEPLRTLTGPTGVFILPGPDALRAEIQRIEEEIGRQQQEKKKRLIFLREIEG